MQRPPSRRPDAAGDELFDDVDVLLLQYHEALDAFDSLPPVVWMPYGHGHLARRVHIPLVRGFARYFAALHIRHSLSSLRTLLVRRALLVADEAPRCRDRIVLVDAFERTLPSGRRLPLHATFAAAVLAVVYGFARSVSDSSQDVKPLAEFTGAVARLDWNQMWHAARHNSGSSLLFTLFGITVAAWLLNLGPLTSFQLKRIVFSLVPGASRKLPDAVIREHRVAAGGIYDLERHVFAPLRRRRPSELRVDLVLEGALCALSLGVVVYLWATLKIVAHHEHLLLRHQWHAAATDPASAAGIRYIVLFGVAAAALIRLIAILHLIAEQQEARRAPGSDPPTVGWRRRATAAVLDAVVLVVLWAAVIVALGLIDPGASVAVILVFIYAVAPVVAFAVEAVLAALLSHGRVGLQTPGKRLTGLAVVTANGGTSPSLLHLFARELFVKAVAFGLIGGPTVFLFLLDITWPVRGGEQPALHDLVARTRVVRVVRDESPQPGFDAVPAMSPF